MKLAAIDYTVVVVEDVDRSLAFYVDRLGLPLKHRSGPFAQLDTGSTQLGLFERQALTSTIGLNLLPAPLNAPGFQLGFKVEDIDEAFSELLRAGAAKVAPPADRPWGQRTAYVRDPDGHLVELIHAPPSS